MRDGAVFRSPRLTMRRWRADDLDALHPVLGDPRVVWWDREAGTLEHSREVLARVLGHNADLPDGLGWFAVTETASGEVVGNVLARPSAHQGGAVELGWHVRADHWRQGIAGEAATATVRHVVGVRGAVELVALISPDNVASQAVATRLGMRPVRRLLYDDEPHLLYSTRARPSPPDAPA